MTQHSKKYVILAGGLTGGPIMPLLAVIKEWQQHDQSVRPVLVDLKKSTSAAIAKEQGMEFRTIVTGKYRRYFSLKNIIAPILFMIGLIQSFLLLRKYKPVAVLGAGGFVQIPLIVIAWILRIPRFIHQQDVTPTLSNQICSMFVNLITTTFEFSVRDFLQGTGLGKTYISTDKVICTGNPLLITGPKPSKAEALHSFHLTKELPVLLVIGGGSGSLAINQLIKTALPKLCEVVQVIHSTGPGKAITSTHPNYHPYSFIDTIEEAYVAADIVLSRAGISTLTYLAHFAKPSIIVPMPESHQELNADLLYQTKSAIVLSQTDLNEEVLIKAIRKLLFDVSLQHELAKNLQSLFPEKAAQKVYSLIDRYLNKHAVSKQS